jgi:hypothetical protein
MSMAKMGPIRVEMKPNTQQIAAMMRDVADEYERLAAEYREGADRLWDRWPPPDPERYEERIELLEPEAS